MRTFSFQGAHLTASDRHRIAQREQIARSLLLNRVLARHVEQTLAALEERKSQGLKPEKIWFLVCDESGTPFVGDAFGFGHY